MPIEKTNRRNMVFAGLAAAVCIGAAAFFLLRGGGSGILVATGPGISVSAHGIKVRSVDMPGDCSTREALAEAASKARAAKAAVLACGSGQSRAVVMKLTPPDDYRYGFLNVQPREKVLDLLSEPPLNVQADGDAFGDLVRGIALYADGRLMDALQALSRPSTDVAGLYVGVLFHRLGQYDSALKAYSAYLEAHPGDPDALTNMAAAYFRLQRYDEAAMTLGPLTSDASAVGSAAAWNNLGAALAAGGKAQAALAALRRAADLGGGNSIILNNLGVALMLSGDNDGAIIIFDRALAADKANALAWNNRGAIYLTTLHTPDALRSFDEALKLKPDYAFALNNKGGGYYYLGRYDDAVAAYKKSLELLPDNEHTYYNLGALYINMGKNREALDAVEKALALSPELAGAWYVKSAALAGLGRIREANEACNRSLALKPDANDVRSLCAALKKKSDGR